VYHLCRILTLVLYPFSYGLVIFVCNILVCVFSHLGSPIICQSIIGLTYYIVFTPYVLEFNRAAIEDKMTLLGRFIGLKKPSFQAVLDWTLKLRREFDIVHTAAELGVDLDRLDDISEMAAKDPTAPTNPVPAGTKEMRGILDTAMEGRLDCP